MFTKLFSFRFFGFVYLNVGKDYRISDGQRCRHLNCCVKCFSNISISISPFFCVMFLLPQQTYRIKKQNWFYFIRSQLSSPKQSRKKNEYLFFFSTIGLIAPIKNIKQNKEKILYSVGFTKLALKFCH